jgi:putative membrane protein
VNSIRLASFELRRFVRGKLPAAALAVLCVVPLLYGALYLYAFWDPYGRLNHVPAAIVVEDVAATASDGSTVDAGQQLADTLIDREIFDWTVTDAKGAEDGLADGTYQLSLRIPRDFSKNLTTGPDQDADPKAAQLLVVSNDGTNYLSGVFSKSVFSEVRASAAESAQSGYFDKMLIGFTDLHTQTQQAADGATKIDDGTGDAKDAADQLSSGLGQLKDGSGKIAGNLGTAARGADTLADGLVKLKAGTSQLSSGTREAAAGGQQLATAVDAAADSIEPKLRDNAQLIEDAATEIAKGADLLSRNVDKLGDAADQAVTNAVRLQDYLDGLPDDTEGIEQARAYAKQLVTDAKRVQATVRESDLDQLGRDLKTVAADARKVAAAAPHLADDVARARSSVDQLAAGLGKLSTGARQVDEGTSALAKGATDLRGGLYQLASGAKQLDNGLGTASDGEDQLASGLGQIKDGTSELAGKLSDGVGDIPSYGDDTADRSDLLADPVSLERRVDNPAATYGVGFAPYFLALALWVGAMITYMVLRPLNRRYVVSGAPAHRVALAGLLPAMAIGLVQATILFLVVSFGLELNPVHGFATLGLLMLTASAFAAIMQLLGAALGPAGRIMSLALLMLQLTSSGGTYPVQTTPGFFQAIHPLLPMTYVVNALRHTIDGGGNGTVVTGILALLAYGLGALALTVVIARRKGRLTATDLHPELVI